MDAVLLRSQGVSNEPIQHLCDISKATRYRYLHEYQRGGVERLTELHFHRQARALVPPRTTLAEYFHAPLPATVAAAQIPELTGSTRDLTHMKPRKLG